MRVEVWESSRVLGFVFRVRVVLCARPSVRPSVCVSVRARPSRACVPVRVRPVRPVVSCRAVCAETVRTHSGVVGARAAPWF